MFFDEQIAEWFNPFFNGITIIRDAQNRGFTNIQDIFL